MQLCSKTKHATCIQWGISYSEQFTDNCMEFTGDTGIRPETRNICFEGLSLQGTDARKLALMWTWQIHFRQKNSHNNSFTGDTGIRPETRNIVVLYSRTGQPCVVIKIFERFASGVSPCFACTREPWQISEQGNVHEIGPSGECFQASLFFCYSASPQMLDEWWTQFTRSEQNNKSYKYLLLNWKMKYSKKNSSKLGR